MDTKLRWVVGKVPQPVLNKWLLWFPLEKEIKKDGERTILNKGREKKKKLKKKQREKERNRKKERKQVRKKERNIEKERN